MRYNKLINTLQNLIGFIPKQAELCKILNYSYSTMSARAQRDSNFNEDEILKIEEYYNVAIIHSDITDMTSLDYFPGVFGSCGSGSFVLSEEKELIQVPTRIFSRFSKSKRYSVINAIGDSMSPFIQSKDKLIIEHYEGEQIKDNQVYVFCYHDEIYVKRLVKNIDEVIVISDNSDPMYKTKYIDKSDLKHLLIIGEIVGLMREI